VFFLYLNLVRSWRVSSLSLFQAQDTQQHKHTEHARERANTPPQTTHTHTLYYYHINILFFPLACMSSLFLSLFSVATWPETCLCVFHCLSLSRCPSISACDLFSHARARSHLFSAGLSTSRPPLPQTLSLSFSLQHSRFLSTPLFGPGCNTHTQVQKKHKSSLSNTRTLTHSSFLSLCRSFSFSFVRALCLTVSHSVFSLSFVLPLFRYYTLIIFFIHAQIQKYTFVLSVILHRCRQVKKNTLHIQNL